MTRKTLFFIFIPAAAMAVSGCDFFRSLVGRPTSDMIADKVSEIHDSEQVRMAVDKIIAENLQENLQDRFPDVVPETADQVAAGLLPEEAAVSQTVAAVPQPVAAVPQPVAAVPQPEPVAPQPVVAVPQTVAAAPKPEPAPAPEPVRPKAATTTETNTLECNYYVMVGVFSVKENARKLAAQASQKGYENVIIDWRDGMTGVALCPTNDLAVAYATLDSVRRDPLFPKDAWIMDKNRKRI